MNIKELFSRNTPPQLVEIKTKNKTRTPSLNHPLTETLVSIIIRDFLDLQSPIFIESFCENIERDFVSTEDVTDGETPDVAWRFIKYLGSYQDGCHGSYDLEFRWAVENLCKKHHITSPISFDDTNEEEKEAVKGIISRQLHFALRERLENNTQTLDDLIGGQETNSHQYNSEA